MPPATHPGLDWTSHPERRASDAYGAWSPEARTQRGGAFVFRYGLALIFVWSGVSKFGAYEARNIEPFVANSPQWMQAYLGPSNLSMLIGLVQIAIGVLLATRPFAPRLSAVGSIGAAITLVIDSGFMLTTPGLFASGYEGAALSALPGQFIAYNLVLLGVSIWTAGEAMHAAQMDQRVEPSREDPKGYSQTIQNLHGRTSKAPPERQRRARAKNVVHPEVPARQEGPVVSKTVRALARERGRQGDKGAQAIRPPHPAP